jgi:putative methionine-R-sulfoxide reductase with GAF domain
MDLATQVLSETNQDKAVQMLVDATYQVACCDRVSLYLIEDDQLVCHAAPAGGHIGWRLPLDKGIAGQVARTGEIMNIPDAYEVPDLFDPSQDLESGYRTMSILTLPLKERNGSVLGVLQAINKKGIVASDIPPEESGAEEYYMAFDASDERTLSLLIALTAQQVRMCELIQAKEKAVYLVDAQLKQIQDIIAHTDIDHSTSALAHAVARTLHCQQVWIFLKEEGQVDDLVCRAAWPLQKAVGSRHARTDAKFGDVVHTGKTLLLNNNEHPKHLGCIESLIKISEGEKLQRNLSSSGIALAKSVKSAIVAPLVLPGDVDTLGDGDDGIVGIAVAANKMITLSDLADEPEKKDDDSDNEKAAA